MARGSLVSIIYHKTLRLKLSSTKNTAALTLMSTDVDRIALTLEKIHEIWASTIETVVAVYLLERQFGLACVAPVTLALCKYLPSALRDFNNQHCSIVCTIGNSWVSKVIPSRLKLWNQSIQKRVSMTSAILGDMKSVKMLNFASTISDTVQTARISELRSSAAFRTFIAIMNTICETSCILLLNPC
jgi:ATP-binding cassette subfamily C (CFTR/MRP) protein 1